MTVPIFLVERRFAEDLEASAEVKDPINRTPSSNWAAACFPTGRLRSCRSGGRRALLREVGGLVAQDTRRKRLARHPQYVPLEASVDAGPTEVEDADPVGLM